MTRPQDIGIRIEHRWRSARKLDSFTNAREHNGQAKRVNVGHIALVEDERYLRRVLPLWDRFSDAVGSVEAVLGRLELSPGSTLAILNPGVPNSYRLFNLLRAAVPTARHVRTHDYIGADGSCPLDAVASFTVPVS